MEPSLILAYLQYQALALWLVLAGGWAWAGANRRAERLRRLAAAACSARPSGQAGIAADVAARPGGGAGGAGAPLVRPPPPVSVVMPVKGCRAHSRDNWESHVTVQYGGPLEFLFVVEAEDDPALPALRELRRRHPRVDVRVVMAGLAEGCSQKAHNLCAGIEACDPRVAGATGGCGGGGFGGRDGSSSSQGRGGCGGEMRGGPHECSGRGDGGGGGGAAGRGGGGYVLCVDDDVALHPGTVEELVGQLEAQPGVFMATGYPFDVPPPASSFAAYLVLSYHLPLLIAFSVRQHTSFVWGGCMLLRGRELLPDDPHGLLAAWRQGGYSDDLILASLCTERRLGILVPPFAIFPQRLDPRTTLAAWANYLHRQLFVLDTYTNEHNRRTNHTMMVLHSLLSWLLVLPTLAALATCAARLLAALAGLADLGAVDAASNVASYGTDDGGALSAGVGLSLAVSHAAAAPLVAAARLQALLPGSVWAVVLGWLGAHLALVFMTAEVLALFRLLSPATPHAPLSWFRWGRLWAAVLLSNAALPLLMAYAYCASEVRWGGVLYRKRRGRVVPVGGCGRALR